MRVRLDHHEKSLTVAGPWLLNQRRVSSASASSGSRGDVGGTRSSTSAYVCCLPRPAPLTTTAASSAAMTRYASRTPSASIPAPASAAASSCRVRWLPPCRAVAHDRRRALDQLVVDARLPLVVRAQPADPRPGQRLDPAQVLGCDEVPRRPQRVGAQDGPRVERGLHASSSTPADRCPSDHLAIASSCACTAPRCRTTAAGSGSGGPDRCWVCSRRCAASRRSMDIDPVACRRPVER